MTDPRVNGMLGLLVGDALGVPYEFHPPNTIPRVVEMDPPDGYNRAHVGTPPGTYSDDGAQALCVLDSLFECDGVDVADIGRVLVAWYQRGLWAVDGHVFDVGIQTAGALNRIVSGTSPGLAGASDEKANGNGSLMRCLPVGLWYGDGGAEHVAIAAMAQSLPTHRHPWSLVSCALYATWAHTIRVEGLASEVAWETAVEITHRAVTRPWASQLHMPSQTDMQHALAYVLAYVDNTQPNGSGFVLDTLTAARAIVGRASSYEDAVVAAIRLGHDTDTTAAVVGGVAGLYFDIPKRWLTHMRGMDPVYKLFHDVWGCADE
jgi:ADP-ribosylglycohydrolase